MFIKVLAHWLRSRRAVEVPAVSRPQRLEDADRPPGCGWFNSSHELSCGLMVTEHVSLDVVAVELPASDGVGLPLSCWGPDLCAA